MWVTLAVLVAGFGSGVLAAVLGVGGFRVASGAITIAQLVTFVMFLFFLVQPLASFFGAITSVNQALGALGFGELLEFESKPPPDRAAEIVARTKDADHSIKPHGRRAWSLARR